MVRLRNPFDAADARLVGMLAALLVLGTGTLLWLAAALGAAVFVYHMVAG